MPGSHSQRAAFEAKQRAGRFAGVDRVDHEQPLESRDVGQQTQTLCAAIDEDNVRGDAGIGLQALDGVNAGAIVGMNQVTETQDQCPQ